MPTTSRVTPAIRDQSVSGFTSTATAEVFAPMCPSRVLLEHVTSRWGILIIIALSRTGMRWGELRRTIGGISEKMLASTLRTLEGDGLVRRTVAATVPPRVDYALTDHGHEVAALLLPLVDWIGAHALALGATKGDANLPEPN